MHLTNSHKGYKANKKTHRLYELGEIIVFLYNDDATICFTKAFIMR